MARASDEKDIAMTPIDLVSPLPRGECVRRLRENVGSYWGIGSGHRVIGEVGGDNIRLRKRIYYRNSFQPTLRGRLSDTPDGGTRIRCEFAELPMLPVLIAVAVLIVLIAGMTVSLLAKSGVQLHNVPTAAIVAPLLSLPFFAALGFGVVYIGRRFARDEPRFLVDFLAKTLEARESKPGDNAIPRQP
jgi:hypothetical protein